MDTGYACLQRDVDIPKAFGIRVTVMVRLSNHVYPIMHMLIITPCHITHLRNSRFINRQKKT